MGLRSFALCLSRGRPHRGRLHPERRRRARGAGSREWRARADRASAHAVLLALSPRVREPACVLGRLADGVIGRGDARPRVGTATRRATIDRAPARRALPLHCGGSRFPRRRRSDVARLLLPAEESRVRRPARRAAAPRRLCPRRTDGARLGVTSPSAATSTRCASRSPGEVPVGTRRCSHLRFETNSARASRTSASPTSSRSMGRRTNSSRSTTSTSSACGQTRSSSIASDPR